MIHGFKSVGDDEGYAAVDVAAPIIKDTASRKAYSIYPLLQSIKHT